MQMAIYLIILGGLGDIIYSFSVEGIIPAHLEYLGIAAEEVSPELRNLDLGFIRAIGGFIIAMGIGSITLLYTGVKRNNRFALWGVLLMASIGEGNNALQMFLLDLPFFAVPLFFILLLWTGALFWLRDT